MQFLYALLTLQEAGSIGTRRALHWFTNSPAEHAAAPLWSAERVVFLNDVYFCARDVIRLLHHNADMACGMDFDRLKLQDMPWEVGLTLHSVIAPTP